MSELGWQAHRSRTSGAHTVRTMRTPPCTVRAHSGLTARHVIHRRAAGRLADQMSSPGDYLPVRVEPAFGIALCGELGQKSSVESAPDIYVRVAMCTKWPPTSLYCSKNSLRGLKEKAFHCKGGRRTILGSRK
eukprot:scaffold132146_cov68-Phaeocystis_antarctica.AAC.2